MIVGERLGSRRQPNKSVEVSASWVKMVRKELEDFSGFDGGEIL